MRRARRWVTVMTRVSALIGAATLAWSGRPLDGIGVALLLYAASIAFASRFARRPASAMRFQRQRWLAAGVVIVLASIAALLIAHVRPVAGTMLPVWAAITVVPTLVWVWLHPGLRRAITGMFRPTRSTRTIQTSRTI